MQASFPKVNEGGEMLVRLALAVITALALAAANGGIGWGP